MVIVESQDETIDKRCIEKGFKYFETLRKKYVQCSIYFEGLNYSFWRHKYQQHVEIKKTTLETKSFKWIIGNKRNNKKVIFNLSKRKLIAQIQFQNWDPGGMHTSTRQQQDGKACGE